MQAAREKRREEARDLLLQVIERDQWNEHAWLWLSGVVDDPRDMQVALANALTINPTNEAARKGLESLRRRHGNLLNAEEEPPPPPSEEPLAVSAGDLEEELPPGATGATIRCYKCDAEIYDVAYRCWSCNAIVHCCENCVRKRETECKEEQGIRGPAAAVAHNECPWWNPEKVASG
ncbi:MAG: tetratricopeptide repeat protein [Chloroflexia bacterium]|nr:tetratricopeptide repeat protein [Chloroflexia bacterium]